MNDGPCTPTQDELVEQFVRDLSEARIVTMTVGADPLTDRQVTSTQAEVHAIAASHARERIDQIREKVELMVAETPPAETSQGHVPDGAWEFDANVTACFEDMLRHSIPQYDVMRETVHKLVGKYRQRLTAIVDLGASRGDGLAPMISEWGAYNQWVAVEVSEPMLAVLRDRFKGYIDASVVQVLDTDLTEAFPPVDASVVLSILTLQFIPIECRQQLLQRAYDSLRPGGALIVVEKVLGDTSAIDDVMVELYYNFKAQHYTQEEIARKRMSLRGVLVPLTAEWNVQLLRRVGFKQVDCFWRWMNFAGWLAVKE